MGLWLMRPRPLTGESAAQLISNTRAYRPNIILDQLEFHVGRYNTSDKDITIRWKTSQQNVCTFSYVDCVRARHLDTANGLFLDDHVKSFQ